jgi:hypothetical protein
MAIDCSKIRKFPIITIQDDGTKLQSFRYINIETNQILTASQVKGCSNIENLDITCATICIPNNLE